MRCSHVNWALVLKGKFVQQDDLFISRYVAGRLSTEDLLAFAESKLKSGVYTDEILAVYDAEPIWEVVSEMFEVMIKSLGHEKPSFEAAIDFLVRYHISQIVYRSANPSQQFELLLRDISGFDLHENIEFFVGDNIGIHKIYGAFHDFYESDSERDFFIFNECKVWLELQH